MSKIAETFLFCNLFRSKRGWPIKDLDCNLNSLETLKKYGMNYSEIWHAEIRGMMTELTPCYTFTSKQKYDIGFNNKVITRHLIFCIIVIKMYLLNQIYEIFIA